MTRKLWFSLGFVVSLILTGYSTIVGGQTPLQPYNPAPFGPNQQNAPSATSTPPAPAYVANRWYREYSGPLVAGVVGSATTTYCYPYYLRATITTNALGVNIQTLGTSNLQLALYNDSAGRPGTLIINSADFLNTTTGAKSVPISSTQIVGPTNIWKCMQTNDATVKFNTLPATGALATDTLGASAEAPVTSGSVQTSGITTPGTYGTWPTLTSNTWTDATTTVIPAIAIFVVSSP